MTITPPNKARRFVYLYDWIEEPRLIRVLLFLIYAVFGYGAYIALFFPPPTILAALGQGYMHALASFLTFGAITAGVAVLPGWYWLERAGAASLTVGAALYAVTVVSLQILDGSELNRGLQLTFVVVVFLALIVRLASIRGADLDPKR